MIILVSNNYRYKIVEVEIINIQKTFILDDYYIVNYGQYSVFVNEDHRPHFFVLTQNSKTDLKGKLEFAITKAHVTDTNQGKYLTNKHINNAIRRFYRVQIFHSYIFISYYPLPSSHEQVAS